MCCARHLLTAECCVVVCQLTLDTGDFAVNITDTLIKLYHKPLNSVSLTRDQYYRCQAFNCRVPPSYPVDVHGNVAMALKWVVRGIIATQDAAGAGGGQWHLRQ